MGQIAVMEELSKVGTVDFHLWLFILTLGLGGVGLARFLDENLTPEWRERLLQYLRSGSMGQISAQPAMPMKPWQVVAKSVSLVFRDVLQAASIGRFLKTSVALSLTIILIAFIYFYFGGEENVRNEITSLFASQRTFFLALCVPLIATMIIDVAAYQTIVFLEMIVNCRKLWQVVVLTYSNILVSIGLFSLLFPFVIVFLLIVENRRSHAGTIYLQPVIASQQDNSKEIYALSMLGNRSAENVKLTNESIIWLIKSRYETEAKDHGTPSLFTVLSSRDFDTNALLPFVLDAFRKLTDAHFKLLDVKISPAMFNLPSAEVKLVVSHAFDYVPFSALYGLAFSQIDLFGTRTLEFVSGDLLSVHAGGLANSLTFELTSTDVRANAGTFIFCDAKVERLRETDAGPALSACKKWAAVSVSSLSNEAARLAAETPSNILVAPFALSSLTTTFVIYFVCFILLYTALVRKALTQFVGSRMLAVENIPLTISAGTVYLLFVIPLALVSYFLGH